jgi:hypothetical protein
MSVGNAPVGIALEPNDTEALASAVAGVCEALKVPEEAQHEREVIATRIIDLAESGERDPQRLRDRVLREAAADAGAA